MTISSVILGAVKVMSNPPLTYEASAGETNMQVSSELPQEVVQCLKNARFVSAFLLITSLPSLQTLYHRCSHIPALRPSTDKTKAPPSNHPQPPAPRLPNELHLPPQHPLHVRSQHNNDDQPLIAQNAQPSLQPPRFPSGPRLGFPPPTHRLSGR